MNDDKDFIDLDSTQNWSQLDVKRELDNLEVNKETGEKYDFARGFACDSPKDEEAILMDGLTSGLNYIPEEFLVAADEKHEEDIASGVVNPNADVSWAYRTTQAESTYEEEPFVALADLEDEMGDEDFAYISLDAPIIESDQDDIEAIRKKNLQQQIEKHAQINASDDVVQANIEARRRAREEAAAQKEAIIKANAQAKKEAQKKAEEEMYLDSHEGTMDMFSNVPMDILELDAPVMTKEERMAAANRYGNVEENEYPATADITEAAVVAAGVAALSDADVPQLSPMDEAKPTRAHKSTAADEYAAWADGDMQGFENLEKKHRKKKHDKAQDVSDEELEEDGGYYYGFFGNIAHFFKKMTTLDILVTCTGVLVVLVAVVTIMIYSASKNTQQKIAEFVPLGENMQTIGLVGNSQFVAVADARNQVPEIEQEEPEPTPEQTEYVEKEDTANVSVTMSLTSVKKDLKIKFINAKTKKLVANHEFKVNIEDAKGKKYSATDDDMDGIIYLNSVTPGKAKVTMAELKDEKGITYSRETVSVNIKENLDYKKIDISDEIKNESQINAKAEDTAIGNDTEGALKDTVEWVESTRTEIEGGYIRIEKDTAIKDPAKITPSATPMVSKLEVTKGVLKNTILASKRILVATTNDDDQGTTPPTGDVTETPTAEATPTDTPTPTPTDTPTPTPTDTPTPTPTEEPTPSPSPSPSPSPTPSPSPSPTPSPKVAPKDDNVTPLLDTKGNQVYYKKEDGTFVEAKYADYYKNLVYYRKAAEGENTKYTGWQVIGDDTFYFDKNGNYVTGEQVIQGAKYTFDSKGAIVKGSGVMGIDVSKWNGNINWTAVKNSGVSFVIIRCGYRGSSTGALIEDPKFKTNIKGATDAGLKVGVYFFSQAITDVEAVEEASMTIDLIKKYKISYPVFLDVEDSNGRGDKIDANTRTAVITAFCQTMKNSGYTAGVYANKSWLNNKMNAGALSGFKIWLAQYNTEVTYTGKYDMWQYSSKGSVNGISGNTDMNLSYLGY